MNTNSMSSYLFCSKKMMQLYCLLHEKHGEVEYLLIKDTKPFFSMYNAFNALLLRSSMMTELSSFYDDLAVNPLQLPKEMFSKNCIKKT